jgi:Voltage-dependent anion channel
MPLLIVLMARYWRAFDVRDHTVALPLFTYVAACAVLAARFAEHRLALWAGAAMALQGWLSLISLTIRSMWRHRRTGLRDNARGGWELATVATSGLAIVAADLAIVFWAVAFWTLGIVIYLFMTPLIARRADFTQPDSWILMGGAAIATLAGDRLYRDLCTLTGADRRWRCTNRPAEPEEPGGVGLDVAGDACGAQLEGGQAADGVSVVAAPRPDRVGVDRGEFGQRPVGQCPQRQ